MAMNRTESQKQLGEANRAIRELQSFRDNLPGFLAGYSRRFIEDACTAVCALYDVRLRQSGKSVQVAEVQERVKLQFVKELEDAGLIERKN